MQRPSPHSNIFSGHWRQSFSSTEFSQSDWPSHRQSWGIHSLPQKNSFERQSSSDITEMLQSDSSDPSWQSFTPSQILSSDRQRPSQKWRFSQNDSQPNSSSPRRQSLFPSQRLSWREIQVESAQVNWSIWQEHWSSSLLSLQSNFPSQ